MLHDTHFDGFVSKNAEDSDILDAVKNGLQYKEIASELGISQRTVETYKRNIFHKMGAENTVEVVLFALRNGLVNL